MNNWKVTSLKYGLIPLVKILPGNYERARQLWIGSPGEYLSEFPTLEEIREGKTVLIATEDFRIDVGIKDFGTLRMKYRMGYLTNLASIPLALRPLACDEADPRIYVPSIIHDGLFEIVALTMEACNNIMLGAMKIEGAGWWLRKRVSWGINSRVCRKVYEECERVKNSTFPAIYNVSIEHLPR